MNLKSYLQTKKQTNKQNEGERGRTVKALESGAKGSGFETN